MKRWWKKKAEDLLHRLKERERAQMYYEKKKAEACSKKK